MTSTMSPGGFPESEAVHSPNPIPWLLEIFPPFAVSRSVLLGCHMGSTIATTIILIEEDDNDNGGNVKTLKSNECNVMEKKRSSS